MHFALTLYVVVYVVVKIHEAALICKVPNGDAGTCVEISTCKPLWDLYKKKHKTKEEHQYIGQAYCGNPSSSKIKVCCPSDSTWENFVINPVKYETPDIFGGDTENQPPVRQTPKPAPPPDTVSFSLGSVGGVMDKTNTDESSTPVITVPVNPEPVNPVPVNPVPVNPLSVNPVLVNPVPVNPLPLPDIGDGNCAPYYSSANKITGGEPTAIDAYPWLVLLEYAGGSLGCGGTLITSRFVMTAAHCLDGINGPPTIVRLAEYNITTYPTDEVEVEGGGMDYIDNIFIDVEITFKHPDYSRSAIQNDIGLVKLAKAVVFSDFIKTACLPIRDYVPDFSTATNFTAAGWGDDPKTTEFFDVKKEVSVPYVPHDRCKSPRPLLDSQMCAGGEEGKDTCKGDSGGPLMYEPVAGQAFIVVGIVSVGPRECGTRGRPAIYTHVYKYLNWISSVVRGQV